MALKKVLDDLLAKRADAVKNMQAITDEANGAALTADQTEKFNRAKADFESYDNQYKAYKAAEAVEDEGEMTPATPKTPQAIEREAFVAYARTGARENVRFENALSTGSSSAGALVPEELYSQIVRKLYESCAMLQLADVINIGAQTNIPLEATPATAYWGTEEGAYTDSAPTFDELTLVPHKLTCLVKASEELLADSAFDVESYLVDNATQVMGFKAEEAFITGVTASSVPLGILTSASVGITSSVTASFAYSDIVGLFASVKSGYRNRGSFLVSDGALSTIMLLQDGANRYIFQPSYKEGVPDMLLNRPMVSSQYMPALASAAKPIAFGDFKYYKIGMRKSITMQRLNELYAGNGQVGFRFFMRVDGKLASTEAIKLLKCK